MGRKRSQSCTKESVDMNRGAWSPQEDEMLTRYVNLHGEGKWRIVALNAGLNRCAKSCRLRWLNYLKPGIKRGNISLDEEELIIRLHSLLGNRWVLIAGRLPGRTDNEIKNYWNTILAKKLQRHPSTSHCTIPRLRKHEEEEPAPNNGTAMNIGDKSFTPDEASIQHEQAGEEKQKYKAGSFATSPIAAQVDSGNDDGLGFLIDESYGSDPLSGDVNTTVPQNNLNMSASSASPCSLFPGEDVMINTCNHISEATLVMELKKLASFLDLEWREL